MLQSRFLCCALLLAWSLWWPVSGFAQEAGSSPAAEAAAANAAQTTADVTDSPAAPTAGESNSTAETTDKADAPEELAEIPFASQPYTVLVTVAFESKCLVDDIQRQQVVRDIQRSLARMYGRLWTTTCERNEWLVPADQRHLSRLQVADVIDLYPEKEFQKVFLVTVEGSGTGLGISCREYDSRIQELTPVHTEVTRDVRSVPTTAARLMRDTFRPSLEFVRQFDGDDETSMMEMQVQGGDMIPPDSSAIQVVPGDVLRPFVRQMDRRDPDKLKHLQGLPLTYLRVLSVDTEETRGLATTAYISHIRFSLFGGKGRRTQHLAVRQRPSAETSRVRLVLKSRPDQPLISHRLALAYQLNWKSAEDGPQTQLVSDRNGEVVIHARENHPTFWIRVYSGTSLLARVPYAPGLIPFDTIELSDDSIRLGVEGEIQLLADELVDAIALREVLMAKARKEAEAGNESQVTSLLARYETVPGKNYFLEQASNIRINASREAVARGLRDSSVNKICKGFSDTVETFFTEAKRAARQAEIQKIRAAVQQQADSAAPN
ncbi:MAG: hypothetical protein R3C59_07675 [Planctomycetaceae bacterium]